ncbi:uncharacterized protein si:ch211-180a12.2 isoform X2 [Coregonus clupeaformis]|uniref:uncharacterized protein si:ch211-180a12.2 isoform X2 n=1 Tax=Coregonus clupeaformis TaxID=59861 RepID=UPI001E1C3427|nr:uncharacterized protein si:ch211-180a12.2 isoform X2 [Coregonus clupeaformis]
MQCKVLLCLYFLTIIKYVSPTDVWVRPYASALLPCSISVPPVDDSLLGVSWTSNGSHIASFGTTDDNHVDKGFNWDTSLFVNGTFSLTVLNATLDQQGVYECKVSYNISELHSSNVTLGIKVPPTLSIPSTVVVLDVESELQCIAEGFSPPLIYFSWTRAGEVVQLEQAVTAVDRTPEGTYWAVNILKFIPLVDDQNVIYGCVVTHAALDKLLSLEFQLSFVYLPTVTLSAVPLPSRDSLLTLSCDIEGFYPEDVSVSWLQNGTELPAPLLSKAGPDGTFRTRRYYTLSPEQRELAGEVECVVHQPSVTEPVVTSLDLAEIDPIIETETVLTKSAKASVALMCISLVLVFLLCFGFSWRRSDEKQKSLNVSGIILPPRVIVGQKGRVTVSVEGRRVDRVQITWFLNDTPISDTSHTVSEKGPLLPSGSNMGYYKLHTQGPLHSTGDSSKQRLLSSLSFIPQICIHKGAVFKCQVSYVGKDKVVVERVSDKFTILAPPEVSEIQLTEAGVDSGVVTLTTQASRFHPDIITFRWFCQGGELSPVASQALSAPRPDTQGFFSAMSQCKLPRAELEHGGTKVWVSVHHIALKLPVTRETRGFIKRPNVSEIISSASFPSQHLTLGCDMTGFYPPDISVTWLRLREGEVDDREEEVIEGGEIWGPMLSGPSTYRANATLRKGEIKEEKKERAGGVVCRVEHCSLEEPIERRWRNVNIAAPSIPSSLTVRWTSEGVGVFSLLLTGGHPKAKVLWAAGGTTLIPLVSNETGGKGEDGQRELRSVCVLERSTRRLSQTDGNGQMDSRKNGHTLKTKAAVTDPDAEGIEYIDERDGENNNVERKVTQMEVEDESGEEGEEGMETLHINRVNVRKGPRGDERARLRVSVEITHPALKLPVHRTWTEPNEEVSSSL